MKRGIFNTKVETSYLAKYVSSVYQEYYPAYISGHLNFTVVFVFFFHISDKLRASVQATGIHFNKFYNFPIPIPVAHEIKGSNKKRTKILLLMI